MHILTNSKQMGERAAPLCFSRIKIYQKQRKKKKGQTGQRRARCWATGATGRPQVRAFQGLEPQATLLHLTDLRRSQPGGLAVQFLGHSPSVATAAATGGVKVKGVTLEKWGLIIFPPTVKKKK